MKAIVKISDRTRILLSCALFHLLILFSWLYSYNNNNLIFGILLIFVVSLFAI